MKENNKGAMIFGGIIMVGVSWLMPSGGGAKTFERDWEGTRYPVPEISVTENYFCRGAQFSEGCDLDVTHPVTERLERVKGVSQKQITDLILLKRRINLSDEGPDKLVEYKITKSRME